MDGQLFCVFKGVYSTGITNMYQQMYLLSNRYLFGAQINPVIRVIHLDACMFTAINTYIYAI